MLIGLTLYAGIRADPAENLAKESLWWQTTYFYMRKLGLIFTNKNSGTAVEI